MTAPSVAAPLPTAFTAILKQAVERVPGARAAIFLDWEGEAIDEYTEASRTGIRLVGAHVGVLFSLARERGASWGAPAELIIETERAVVVVQAIADQYLVVLEAAPEASLGLLRRELARATDALRAEI